MFKLTILAATCVLGSTAFAASVNASATVVIIAPITLTKTADLNFGTVAPTTSAGTVVMSPSGVRTGTNVILSTLGAGNAAGFTVTGNPNSTFSVTLPTSISLTGAGPSMTVNNFTSSLTTSPALSSSGSSTFKVGGTLAVRANQSVGTYTGTFTVTVNYN